MRRIVDIAAVLLVVAVAAGVMYFRMERQREEATERLVFADVQRFQQEVQKRAATGESTTNNARGWPITIEPAWFGGNPPQNPLLSSDRPWVEVAPTEQAYLLHPEVRIATDKSMAAFWYNPYQGIVRTRVPAMLNDDQALALYNRLNRCALSSIFQTEPAPRIVPVPGAAEATASAPVKSEDGSDQSASVPESGPH